MSDDEKNDDLSDLEMTINLKDGPQRASSSGIRSPIVDRKLQNPSEAPSRSGRDKITPKEVRPRAAKRNYQKHSLNHSEMNRVMSDPYIKRRKSWLKALIFSSVVAFCAFLYLKPDIRNQLINGSIDLFNKVKTSLAALESRQSPEISQTVISPSKSNPRPEVRQSNISRFTIADGGDCHTIVHQGLSKIRLKGKAIDERTIVAQCFMVFDNPSNAAMILRPLQGAFEKYIAGSEPEPGLGNALLLFILSQNMQSRVQESDVLLRQSCSTWERSPICVAKLLVYTFQNFMNSASDGYKKLQLAEGQFSGFAKPIYWYVGGKIAELEGDYDLAHRRFRMAEKSVARDAWALKKMIYESHGIALLLGRKHDEMLKLAKLAFKDLRFLDKKGRVKLSLLYQLAETSGNQRETLRGLLVKESILYRIRSDIDLVDVIGNRAIEIGLENEFLSLLEGTVPYFRTRLRASPKLLARLLLWKARTLFSLKRYEKSLQILENYKGIGIADVIYYHLRGSCFHALSANERYQALALDEFVTAMKKRSNWESLYGIGATSLAAGKSRQVVSILNDLQKLIKAKYQRYWYNMLRADFYIESNQVKKAEGVLRQVLETYPNALRPRELLIKIYKRAQQQDMVTSLDFELDELYRQVRPQAQAEGLADPLGALALTKRPLE